MFGLDLLDGIRIGVLLVISFIFAYFDLFNKRNIPNMFAYGSVIIGFLITLTYPLPTIETSLLIFAVIAVIGYITYRLGVLGAGDTYEFAFISLVMPLQVVPFLVNVGQFNLPFVLSVFIATGYATVLTTPFYYMWISAKKHGGFGNIKVNRRNFYKALLIIVVYGALLLGATFFIDLSFLAAILIFLIAIPSAMIIIYEEAIYEGMVEMVYPRQLEDGDMIATKMMSKSDISYFSARSKRFGRLVTVKLISDIKSVKRKLPVYKNAIPLAFFAFVGVIVSLLFGNIILLIISSLL